MIPPISGPATAAALRALANRFSQTTRAPSKPARAN